MTKAEHDTGPGLRNYRWRIQDLIDLEYFLHADNSMGGNDNGAASFPKARDIYLGRLRRLGDGMNSASRRLLIRRWLEARRESEATTLPGSIYSEVSRICLAVAAVLGIFAGMSMAMSLLDYSGTRPLNVSIYMGVAVFSQMLLLLIWAVVFFFRAASRSLVRHSVLMKLMGRMFSAILLRVRKGAFKSLDGRKRDAMAAVAGLLRGRKQVYGSLFFWPAFILMQVFAVCFNIGLLGATLAKLSGSDVAFGWQSTFQVSTRAVFQLVQAIALPWRWWVPSGLAYPSLDAIEGSRIILKEGIQSLATGDLVSWWPFLCLSVFFYGFFPRLILLVSGVIAKRHLLTRLRFDHGACERLVRTMTSPAFSTTGVPVAPSIPSIGETPTTSTAITIPEHVSGKYVALVPEDISSDCEGLEAVAARGLAIQVTDRKIVGVDEADDRTVFDALEKIRSTPNFAGVLVLQEAWQPPIQESLIFLKQLRRRLGKAAGIVVGVVGKPGPDTLFTAPREEDFRIWKHRVDALGDPYLVVERLVGDGLPDS